MKLLPLALLATLPVSLLGTAESAVTLPSLFSDHAVLQREQTVPVWGWADAREKVTVTFAGQTKTATAGADGKWRVELDQLKTGEAGALVVKGTNTITINDVLVGEVWLCSGQSNMGFRVDRAADFEQEKAAANHPTLRVFTVASSGADQPQEKCAGKWVVTTPDAVGGFSAVAYFYGRELLAKLGAPVGLIVSAVGGTPIEAWTSIDVQRGVPELKPIFDSWEQRQAAFDPVKAKADNERRKAAHAIAAAKAKAEGKAVRGFRPAIEPRLDSKRPVNLYNGKIAPLIPYAIRGAIWYQGESNAATAETGLAYRTQLPLMIKDWRKRWGYDFPFAWVQLPELDRGNSEGWCLVREGMLKALSLPRTGMAVALGLGDVHDVHPNRKQGVSQRLAAWALAEVYGKGGASSGPLFQSQAIQGDKVTITFTHVDGGLMARDGEPKGLTIAGTDQVFKPATARIEGDKLIVSSPEVKAPMAVRYAWKDNPEFNLYNGAGLPASPFRTDDWPVIDAAAVRK